MDCSEFLELYSDYRDGRLDDARVTRSVREHLSECEACMRYDASVCRGVMALRSTDELEPTRPISFSGMALLPDSAETHSPMPAKFVGGLMVAAAIALLLWPQTEEPLDPPSVARVEAAPPPPAVVLPDPKPLPVRDIEAGKPVLNAQFQPRLEQVSYEEWVAVP
jgi:hypothetical protein